MNIIFPLIRPLRSWLGSAFLVVCVLFTATAIKAEAEYTFTLVADNTGPFSDFGAVPSPSLSALGTVAFNATLDQGGRGVFSGNGGMVTTIATTSLFNGAFGYPSINPAGTVAFQFSPGTVAGERILAGNGGPLATIADTAGQFQSFVTGCSTSINASGTVAFWALPDSGPTGIFASNGGAATPIVLSSASLATGFNIAMNDAGTIAFRSSNETRIATTNGGLITTIVDNSGPLNYFGSAPSINNAGRGAFVAGVNGIDGVSRRNVA